MKTRGQTPKAAKGRAAGRGRGAPVPRDDERRRRTDARRDVDAPPRDRRQKNARVSGPAREQRALRHGPATTPNPQRTRPKSTSQAKARAKARKAKAPKVVRVPLRERLLVRLTRLAEIELNPRTLLARIPFVVLVIAALGMGLAVTLWLSTYAAERSYQLGHARRTNDTLQQQKEALERQVLEAQAAPALAEAASNLGMIPSRDTAHLVQESGGNWIVVGTPKPAQGTPPPPLNTKLPDNPPPAPVPTRTAEGPVRVGIDPAPPSASVPEVPVPLDHAPVGPAANPLGAPLTGPAPGPAGVPGLLIVPVPADAPALAPPPPADTVPAPPAPPAPPALVAPLAPVAPPAPPAPPAPVAPLAPVAPPAPPVPGAPA